MGYLNNMPTFLLPSVVSTPFLAPAPLSTLNSVELQPSMLQLPVTLFPLDSELDLSPCNL